MKKNADQIEGTYRQAPEIELEKPTDTPIIWRRRKYKQIMAAWCVTMIGSVCLAACHAVASATALLALSSLIYVGLRHRVDKRYEHLVANPPRTRNEWDKLTLFEIRMVRKGQCPDCENPHLEAGPSGGLSQNFYCPHYDCGSRFNDMGPFGIDRITRARPRLARITQVC